jgi:anhydro-N-acetylmuramic acid kinase
MSKTYKAIGLMSGTSADGIDLSMIESNGEKIIKHCGFSYLPYSAKFKAKLHHLIYEKPSLEEIKSTENELTILHANLVNEFLANNKIKPEEIDAISFHGHTIFHKPQKLISWQIGNPCLLSHLTKIKIVSDLRNFDIVRGGQGAPLVPIYHFYLFANEAKPCAALNIGGISNITFFENENEEEIQAFDICFGNGPIDDLVKEKLNLDFDKNGEIALSGNVDFLLADRILQNEIFHAKPPKSFDRHDFDKIIAPINNLKINDALATFAYMHAKAIEINLNFLSQKPKEIIICGGGRKNQALIKEMQKNLHSCKITISEDLGFNGDEIEAAAFAFLAIRRLRNLPISFKNTTGINLGF